MKNLQVALLIALTLLLTENTNAQNNRANSKKSVANSFANAPNPASAVQASQLMGLSDELLFEENKGQLKDENGKLLPEIKYYGHQAGVNVYCKPGMISFVFTKVEKTVAPESITSLQSPKQFTPVNISASRTDLILLNSNASAIIIPYGQQEFYKNYYTTGDADHGITNVRTFKTLTYKEIYPHIDMVLDITNSTHNSSLEYSFIVHSGGLVSDIKLHWNGTDKMESLENGGFRYTNSLGIMEESAPKSIVDGIEVESSFYTEEDNYGFKIESYDKTKDLLIDPILSWATYYGGGNDDMVIGLSTDPSGNVYVTGNTYSSSGIATSFGYKTYLSAYSDAILAKFSSSGGRTWATYYGSSGDDAGWDVRTDSSGNVFVVGQTNSNGGIATGGAFQTSYGGTYDAILLKFSSAGTLSWATYYGGTGEDNGIGICTDQTGNAYITGFTSSGNLGTSGVYKNYLTGGHDAFLTKFSSSGSRTWGTYYGGSDEDRGSGISADPSGNVFITGSTNSTGGIATSGAYQTSNAGGDDAFLAKFSSSGSLIWATWYGGSSSDGAGGVSSDVSGSVYFTGATYSSSGIATSGAYQTSLLGGWSGEDAFLAKFSSSGSLSWATYYGGYHDDAASGISTDASGNVYITGSTGSTCCIATSGGYQTSNGGADWDAFLAKFSSSGSLLYGSYLGGSNNDFGSAVRTDVSGTVYVAGRTASSGQATSAAYQTSHAGGTYDIFLAKFNFGYSNDAGIDSVKNPAGSLCPGPHNVIVKLHNYGNQSLSSAIINWAVNGTSQTSYSWTGTLAAGASANVTISSGYQFTAGVNKIAAYTSQPNGIKDSLPANDTSNISVIFYVLPSADAGSHKSICTGDSISIGAPTVTGSKYSWISSPIGFTSVSANPTVNPASNTTYYLTETVLATSCSKSDSVKVTVNPLPAANAGSNKTICNGESISIGSTAVNGNTYAWNSVPGGFTSSSADPSVSPGSSTVFYLTETITATGCSKADVVTVKVNPLPAANAGSDKNICSGGTTSIGASSKSGNTYLWTSNPSGFISVVADPTVNPTITTSYYLTEMISSTGCTKSDFVNVIVHPLPVVTASADATTVCVGTMVTLKGSGALSYSWSGGVINEVGFVPTFTNSYMVTGTDSNNCSGTAAITVNVKPLPLATTYLMGTTIISNQNGATWQWLDCNNGFSPIAGATNQSFIAVVNGNYAVEITMNACSDTSACVAVANVGIEQTIKNNDGLIVYPNPSSDAFTVQATKEGSYSIINSLGQVIHEFDLNELNNYHVQIENLGSGVYFVVGDNNHRIIRQKVIVTR